MKEYNIEVLKDLSKAIIKLFDNDGKEIEFNTIEIILDKSKYSSSHNLTPVLLLDGERKIFRNKSNQKYRVEYKCSCGRINNVLLCKYVGKTRFRCVHCSEDEEKRKRHSEIIKKFWRGENYETLKIKQTKRTYDFENEDSKFKEEYFKNNLTLDEFFIIKKYIYSVNDVIVFNKEYELLLHENGVNAKKYRQMILIDGKKMPFKNFKLICPNCGKIYSISRPIKNRVINNNFYCKDCVFCNYSFPIKKYRDNLTYQGNLELSFIKKCDELNIDIINGDIIEYYFNNVEKKYFVDFYLPKYRLLVEIKDNHIWHRQQIENGKWESKLKYTNEYCIKNNKNFKLLFPNDIDNFFKNLERDSLNFSEN